MSFRDLGHRKRASHRQVAKRAKEHREKMASSADRSGASCYNSARGWAALDLGGSLVAHVFADYPSEKMKTREHRSHKQSCVGSTPQADRTAEAEDTSRRSTHNRRRKGPPRTVKKKPLSSKRCSSTSPPRKTTFSQIADEIKHFQKLVRELEELLEDGKNGTNVEDQWRTRILLRSGEEADESVSQKLDQQLTNSTNDVTVQTSLAKLNRDYKRARDAFHSSVAHYVRKQAAEVSLLSSHDPFAPNRATIQQQEEDFYDRAVREREEDLRKMNAAMHKVNDIYSDLAKIVSEQQDQIDQVEDKMRSSRAYTEVAAENFRKARAKFALCGSGIGRESDRPRTLSMMNRLTCGGGERDISSDNEFDGSSFGSPVGSEDSPEAVEPDADIESEARWVEPLKMIKDDMVDVSHNLVGFGKDFVRKSRAKFVACAGPPNEDDYMNYILSDDSTSTM